MHFLDTQCGAKIIDHDTLKQVLPRIGSTQWAFDVELIFQVRRTGRDVVEAPVIWRDQKGSKVRVFRSAFEMVLALSRLRLLYSPFRWVVHLWDRSLGRRLFARRMQRMAHTHASQGEVS
jgi:hypothetical protein